MVSASRFETRSRIPFPRTSLSCSDGNVNSLRSDLYLARACSLNCTISDAEATSKAHAHVDPALGPTLSAQRSAQERRATTISRLTIDILSQQSQECPSTQGFSTPVEQKFGIHTDEYASMDEGSRPASPSPLRHQKRFRKQPAQDVDSDCMSHERASQSKSQGEPSSCSKATAVPRCRPPIPKSARRQAQIKLRCSPQRSQQHGGGALPDALLPSTPKKLQSRLYRDYIVEGEVGQGHFSTVFKAVHRQCGKAYAIKKSRKPLLSLAEQQAWLEEVRILAIVGGHPNITTYHDSWSEHTTAGEFQYIKLELCDSSLGMHVKAKQALLNSDLWDIAAQVASALSHIHKQGLVHLDVKPDNIFRAASGTIKLGDFGLATLRDGSKSISEGDARYLAPEMLQNQYDQLDKADMFALGATLYELASGCPLPASGERWQAIRQGKLAVLPAATHQMQTLIKKLLSHDPAARPDAEAVIAICSKQRGPAQMRGSQRLL